MAHLDIIANLLENRIRDFKLYRMDIGIAGEHLELQAKELGLGTCSIGCFNERKTREFFKIPKRCKIVLLIAIGYPAKRPPSGKKRKPLEDIARFN